VNPKKCAFGTDTVEFLGFLVGLKGIEIDPSWVEAIQDWPLLASFRDIQVFLGFTNFYRRFIQSYSKVSHPLTELLKGIESSKKASPFQLTPRAIAAFKTLKEYFLRAPML